jgi:hypothetical protein
MASESWLRRAGQERAAMMPECRAGTCWIERPGHLVAVVAAPAGLVEACTWATTLVTTLEVWRDCAAPAWILDRATILREGAIELRLLPGGDVAIRTTRAVRGDRPWSREASPRAATAEEEPQ